MKITKTQRRKRIQQRIRKALRGTAQRPRLSVFRSNSHIYCQLIDDIAGNTLMSATSKDESLNGVTGTNTDMAKEVGKLIGQKAVDAGIQTIVFDRGGYLYHGRVKALADGARESGLQF